MTKLFGLSSLSCTASEPNQSSLIALTAATLLFFGAPASAQQHDLEGGVSLAYDVRHDSPRPGSLTFRGSVTSGDTLFTLYGRSLPDLKTAPDRVRVVATDTGSGALLWDVLYSTDSTSFDSPGSIVAAPDGSAVFVNVYVTSLVGPGPASSMIVRFDALDGTASELVKPASSSGPVGVSGIAVSPTGTTLYLAGNGGANEGTVLAYDWLTGSQLWEVSDRINPITEIEAGPASVIVTYLDLKLFDNVVKAFDSNSGAELWVVPSGVGILAKLALSRDGSVLAVDSSFPVLGGTQVFDATTGTLLWSKALLHEDLIVSDDGSVVFGTRLVPGPIAQTTAFDGATGVELWKEQFSAGTGVKLRDLATHTGAGLVAVGLTLTSGATSSTSLTLNYDAATGSLTWLHFGNTENDYSVGYTTDGSILYSSGTRNFVLPQGQIVLEGRQMACQTSDGDELWERLITGTTTGKDAVRTFAVTPDGSTALVAGISKYLDQATNLVAFDTETGDESWAVQEGFPIFAFLDLREQDLAFSPDSQVVFHRVRFSDEERITARRILDGAPLWSRTLSDSQTAPDFLIAGDIAVSNDGTKLFVTYFRENPALFEKPGMAVFALDPVSGVTLWEQHLDNGGFNSVPSEVVVAPDDASIVIIGSYLNDLGDREGVTNLLGSSTGAVLWTNFAEPEHVVRACYSQDGQTVFIAVTGILAPPYRHTLYAYDRASGAQIWSSASNLEVEAADMKLSLDGTQLVIGGTSLVFTSFPLPPSTLIDLATIAYDAATGAEQWQSVSKSSSSDIAGSLDFGEDGNTVFITGHSGEGFRTLAYDLLSGAELWSADFSEGILDPLTTVVGTADNRLYVSGTDANFDLALLAYDIPDLVTDNESVSLAAGGTSNFGLRPGLGSDGDFYFLLGSASGTSPGTSLGGNLLLPLEIDAYFFVTLKAAASALSGFRGNFDVDGLASASISIPAGLDPTLAGVTLHHAFIAAEQLGIPTAVSNAVELTLVP